MSRHFGTTLRLETNRSKKHAPCFSQKQDRGCFHCVQSIFTKFIFSLPPSLCSSSWLSSLAQGSLVHNSLQTQAYVEDRHFYGANTAILISVSKIYICLFFPVLLPLCDANEDDKRCLYRQYNELCVSLINPLLKTMHKLFSQQIKK